MNILWLNWRCWLNPDMGGAEVFTYEVAKRWADDGHQITLFTSKFSNAQNEETVDGIKIVRAGGRLTVQQAARKVYSKRFQREKFDVIIDEINTRPFFAHQFSCNNEKIVALIHQLAREFWFYETPFPINYLGYYYLENLWLKQYINIPTVTVSESTRCDLKKLGFNQVFVVPEGLNFKPTTSIEKSPNPVLAFSGRLKRAKRPDHAIKAFGIVKEETPDAELWVFGDGPFKKKLEQLSMPGVKFFGNLNNLERREMLGKSWVLMVPGVREGWGLNVIEGNALGLPAVAYNAPGLCDSVKDNETGLLAESGNIEELAEKTQSLLSDISLREKLSLNALQFSKTFNWDKTADEFMKLIKHVK